MISAAVLWVASTDVASVSASPPYRFMSSWLAVFVSMPIAWLTAKAMASASVSQM